MTEVLGLVVCMDEAIQTFGEVYEDPFQKYDQINFGLAGSGVAKRGGGDEQGLPDWTRKLFKDNQRGIIKGFENICRSMGGIFYVASHAGCAWAGLQGIKDASSATLAMCKQWGIGVNYAGHIEYGNYPVQIGKSPANATIIRHPDEHHHGATSIAVPIGGGITGSELAKLESGRYGDAFIIDADFAAEAVAQGWMTAETAVSIVAAQLDKANGIMNGQIEATSVVPFDAGRLSVSQRGFNEWVFDTAVASLKK